MRRLFLLAAMMIALVSCGSSDLPLSDEPSGAEENTGPTEVPASAAAEPTAGAAAEPVTESIAVLFPDVVAAEATLADDGTYRFDVTLSSPYDSPARYADAWRVLGPDGTEFGVRVLTHDHAGEQPFTRSLTGVDIPEDISTVTIEGRDQISGWGGATISLDL